MGAVKNQFIDLQIQESQAMQKAYDEHDCKASPDSGCTPCIEYMDYFHLDEPYEFE